MIINACGGIRTHEAFRHQFLRLAPSAARTHMLHDEHHVTSLLFKGSLDQREKL